MNSAHCFSAMGTEWAIDADRPDLGHRAEMRVRAFEARLSRFLPGSALSRLNREREVEDEVLAEVVSLALEMQRRTQGAFDPRMGAQLAALGYDRDFDQVGSSQRVCPELAAPAMEVRVDGPVVRFDGEGALDLGGIAKGWAVDRVHDWLHAQGAREILVDGGGDLRGAGRAWPIGVGEDGAILLREGGVATSSILRRRWSLSGGEVAHHVLDPETGRSTRGPLQVATVRAADAATADALATALLAAPARVVPLLAGLGACARVQGEDGRWWTTPDWEEER